MSKTKLKLFPRLMANKIIESYESNRYGSNGSWNYFSCNEVGFYSHFKDGVEDRSSREVCRQLIGVLEDGFVTDQESYSLMKDGYSKRFISKLSGQDGARAFNARIKWLSENVFRAEENPDDMYSYGRWHDAVRALTDLGGPAAPELATMLVDKQGRYNREEDVRDALIEIGYAAVPALIEVLSKGSDRERQCAAMTLGGMGPQAQDAIPALMALARNEDPKARDAAATAIKRIDLMEGIDTATFLKSLLDERESVRNAAASDLTGSPRSDDVIKGLKEAMKDVNDNVRYRAITAIIKIASDETTFQIIAEAVRDPYEAVRYEAVNALESYRFFVQFFGTREMKETLIDAFVIALRDPDEAVRCEAMKALGDYVRAKFGVTKNLREKLINAFVIALGDDYGSVRLEAAKALGEIGHGSRWAKKNLQRALKYFGEESELAAVTDALWKIEK